MKKLLFAILILVAFNANAQVTGSVTVGGDFDKFYPTVWYDGGWSNNAASELELGRSEIHINSNSRGGLIARFKYHTNAWGNGTNFIDTDIMQVNNKFGQDIDFIAGWVDASWYNGTVSIIIWLRGGGTTYYYKSLYQNTCRVYDGVANSLPFQEENGAAHSYKTSTDSYVNSSGLSKAGTGFFNGAGINYFAGNVGIGTIDPKGYKLAVAGNMIAESVKVKLQGSWPDYVFRDDYKLPTLQETEQRIKENGHLEGIPSAKEVKANGIDLGEMNAKLLQKIEELTLHLIEQNKTITEQNKRLDIQQLKLDKEVIMLNKLKYEIEKLSERKHED